MYIDKNSSKPVYMQITDGLIKMISDGVLAPGDQLPSVRELSANLSVNPNTIAKSFGELAEKGLTVSVHGSGSYVSANALEILSRGNDKHLQELTEMITHLKELGMGDRQIYDAVNSALEGGSHESKNQ